MFRKKVVFKNFTKFTVNHLSWSLCFNKVAGLQPATLLKKETPTHVFSCEFCEIFKNTIFYRTPPAAASKTTQITEVTNKRRRPIDGVLNPFRYFSTVVVFAGSDLYRVENIYTKLFGNR